MAVAIGVLGAPAGTERIEPRASILTRVRPLEFGTQAGVVLRRATPETGHHRRRQPQAQSFALRSLRARKGKLVRAESIASSPPPIARPGRSRSWGKSYTNLQPAIEDAGA